MLKGGNVWTVTEWLKKFKLRFHLLLLKNTESLLSDDSEQITIWRKSQDKLSAVSSFSAISLNYIPIFTESQKCYHFITNIKTYLYMFQCFSCWLSNESSFSFLKLHCHKKGGRFLELQKTEKVRELLI